MLIFLFVCLWPYTSLKSVSDRQTDRQTHLSLPIATYGMHTEYTSVPVLLFMRDINNYSGASLKGHSG